MTKAGRYAGRPREAWLVRPSERVLERRAAWAARAGAAQGQPGRTPTGHPGAQGGDAQVGASIWQTPGGVQSELERINSDFTVFASEFEGFVKTRGYPTKIEPSLRPLVELFDYVWTPLLKEWRAFFEKNKGWWDNFWWNHAPEGEQFSAQLVTVRARANELGMTPNSPAPTPFAPSILFDPQRNVFDRVSDGAQTALADVWQVVKIALYAGVAIAGGYVVLSLAKTTKGPEAPR
jgi:hypothetical protein